MICKALILLIFVAAAGCAARPEHWTQRPPCGACADKVQTVDEAGEPNFGPKPQP
jgi:hypothetical protein